MSLKSLVSDGLRNFTLGRHVHITSPQLACVSTWSGESKTELLKHRSTGRPKPRRSKSLYEGRNIEVDQGDLQLEVILTIRVDGKKTQNKKTHTKKDLSPVAARPTCWELVVCKAHDSSVGMGQLVHGYQSRQVPMAQDQGYQIFVGSFSAPRKLWLEFSLWSLNSTW